MRTRPMLVGLLVCSNRKLRNVTGKRTSRHIKANMAAAGTALLRRDKRQVHGVGHKIRLQQKAILFALCGEIVGLSGKALLEVVRIAKDKIEIVVHIDNRRRKRDRDKPCRFCAGAVEMLMPAIQRDSEDR